MRDGEILELPAGYSIHRAFYGDSSKHWDKSGGRDVAEKLRYLLSDDSRPKTLCVCSDLFGEPLTKGRMVLLAEGACVEETRSPLLTLENDEPGNESWIGDQWIESGIAVMSAVFLRDVTLVLTAAYNGVACVWCAKAGACMSRCKGTGDTYPGLYTAVFSSDETKLITASASGVARLWRIHDGALEWELYGHDDAYMRCATLSPDRRFMATASALRQLELVFKGHDGWVNTAVFSPDRTQILTAAAARLWCTSTGKLIHTFTGHHHFVRTAVFSQICDHVLTSSFDWTAKLWDIDLGTCVSTFIGYEALVNSASLSIEGALIIT